MSSVRYIDYKNGNDAADGTTKQTDDTKNNRLYVRLSGDRDPNTAQLELASRETMITIQDRDTVTISGLSFSFLHVPQVHHRFWDIPEENPACVKALGSARNIRISNDRFFHVVRLGWVNGLSDESRIDGIYITDNDMAYCDSDAILVQVGNSRKTERIGSLGRVDILRDRITEVDRKAGISMYIDGKKAPCQ